jgi:acyl carrier protein
MSSPAPSGPAIKTRQDVEDAVIREFRTAAGHHSVHVSLASDYRKDLGINSMGFVSAICALEKRLGISLIERLDQLSTSTRLSDVASTIVFALKRQHLI